MSGSIIDYSDPIKTHAIATPNSGNAAARLATLSQTTTGKILVWAGATVGVKVLCGGASIDADVAIGTARLFIVKPGFSRIVDTRGDGYVSVKALTAADETIYIEEVG